MPLPRGEPEAEKVEVSIVPFPARDPGPNN